MTDALLFLCDLIADSTRFCVIVPLRLHGTPCITTKLMFLSNVGFTYYCFMDRRRYVTSCAQWAEVFYA